MAKIEQYSRIIQHRITGEGVVFTNPTSNDHTDGTWSEKDLYIGEIGINVTDDKMFFRTNNGIVEVGTGATTSASTLWSYTNEQLAIGGTYAPTAIVRNNNSFVDLGDSTLRFKDLYLGGSSDGIGVINVNNGFTIRDANDDIITTNAGGNNLASITMATASSTSNKTRAVQINSVDTLFSGTFSNCVAIASFNSTAYDSNHISLLSTDSVVIGTASNYVTYVGKGWGREFQGSNSLVVGGELYIRGVEDDTSTHYNNSDLVKGQTRLTTSNALTTPIFTYSFPSTLGGVVQIKAKIIGMDISNAELCYSAEIMTLGYKNTGGTFIANDPIISEINVFDPSIEVYAYADGADDIDISVKGTATDTIQWLCSYEYHSLLNTNI